MIEVLGNSEFFSILFHQQFNSIISTRIISPHKINTKQESCKFYVWSCGYSFTFDFN